MTNETTADAARVVLEAKRVLAYVEAYPQEFPGLSKLFKPLQDAVEGQGSTDAEYTYEHLEAAACMWEHVLTTLRRHREKRNPWEEFREAYGMAELRERVIRHAPTLEVEYQKAVENGYDKAFDWEYVPKYMEEHVTRILT